MEKEYRYDAFISYRHTEMDRFVAESLHRQLENFKLPGNIRKKQAGRTRIKRVFRDKEELPLTSNLEEPIMDALAESEYLIVICSPRLRASLWCKKEIETFIRMHGRQKILAVLIEGEPEESFPEELLYQEETIENPDGSRKTVKKLKEPLAADVRGKNKRAMKKAMKKEILRLLAPMFSLSYDDLRQRHRERRMRRILTAVTLGAAVCLGFGAVSTAMALRIHMQKEQIEAQNAEIQNQSAEIQKQNALLLENQALTLAEESLRRLQEGDRIGAIRTATAALTEYEGIALPYTAEAQYALTKSLYVYDAGSCIKPFFQVEMQGNITFIKVSADGTKMMTGDSAGNLVLWDLETGKEIEVFPTEDIAVSTAETDCAFIDSDKVAFVDKEGRVLIYGISEESKAFSFKCSLQDVQAISICTDREGRYLLVQQRDSLFVYDTENFEILQKYVPEEGISFSGDYFFEEEGCVLAIGEKKAVPDEKYSWKTEQQVRFLNLETGFLSTPLLCGWSMLSDVCFADGRAYVLYTDVTEDLAHNMSHLTACDMQSGNIFWENTYEGIYAKKLYRSYAEGISRILMTAYDTAYAVEREDGSLHGVAVVGSAIAGAAVYVNTDKYILFTSRGEFLLTDGATMETYEYINRFQCHSQNVEKFIVAGNGFLIKAYTDNKVTCYHYSEGSDAQAYEGVYPEQTTEAAAYAQAVLVAEEYGLSKAELAEYTFFNEDKSLFGISYTDDTFEIYTTGDMTCVCSAEAVTGGVRCFAGVDAAGNLYVSGGGYGYMLTPAFELIGEIEGLVYVDAEAGKLLLKDTWGNLKTVPVYTVEELLAKAETYVLR